MHQLDMFTSVDTSTRRSITGDPLFDTSAICHMDRESLISELDRRYDARIGRSRATYVMPDCVVKVESRYGFNDCEYRNYIRYRRNVTNTARSNDMNGTAIAPMPKTRKLYTIDGYCVLIMEKVKPVCDLSDSYSAANERVMYDLENTHAWICELSDYPQIGYTQNGSLVCYDNTWPL